MAGFTEMTVDSIRVHMPTGQHVVILKEKEAERYLPIWIGINEANAIALRITGITPDRPITHDLLCNILGSVDVSVEKIEVTSLSNDVFFARIVAKTNGSSLVVDARPSDAIAVAVRVGAAIFVADEVLDKAGVLPEQEKEGGDSKDESPEEKESIDEKLTIFREMVNSMDLPDLDSEGRPPES
jgi:bifunctional DNase/RNase